MAIDFENQSFQRGQAGLYLPAERITEIVDYAENLEKARLDGRALSPIERRITRSIGQLFNNYRFFHHAQTWGQAEKSPGTVTHRLLRQTFSQSLIDQLIVNARIYQMRHFSHRVVIEGQDKGWKVLHCRHSDPEFEVTEEIKERSTEVEGWLQNRINKEIHPRGISDFFVKAIQGEMVIDRKAAVIVRDRLGRPISYHLLPGDDIKPRLEVLLKHMDVHGQTYWGGSRAYRREKEDQGVERIFAKFGVDTSEAAYIQEIDNIVTGAWRAEDISVDLTAPSDEINNFGYGISSLERSLEATTLLMFSFNYNKSHFNTNYPENMLLFEGDVDDVALEGLKQQIFAEVGPQGNLALPMMSTGAGFGEGGAKPSLVKLRDSIKDMEMPSLIRLAINLKLSAYRAHPSLLNMSVDRGATSPGILSEGGQGEAIDLAQEEGLHSLFENMADWLTRAIVSCAKGYEDYRVVFITQCQPTQQEQIEIWSKKLATGAYLMDEFRASQGDKPMLEATEGRVHGKWASNQLFFEAQQAQQQEQDQLMAELYPETQETKGQTEEEDQTEDDGQTEER